MNIDSKMKIFLTAFSITLIFSLVFGWVTSKTDWITHVSLGELALYSVALGVLVGGLFLAVKLLVVKSR